MNKCNIKFPLSPHQMVPLIMKRMIYVDTDSACDFYITERLEKK